MSEILTNKDFITSIDKVITSLGATPSSIPLTPDQENDMVDKDVFDKKMVEVAAASPSGGNSGSPYIINVTATLTTIEDDGDDYKDYVCTTDKTIQEIAEAYEVYGSNMAVNLHIECDADAFLNGIADRDLLLPYYSTYNGQIDDDTYTYVDFCTTYYNESSDLHTVHLFVTIAWGAEERVTLGGSGAYRITLDFRNNNDIHGTYTLAHLYIPTDIDVLDNWGMYATYEVQIEHEGYIIDRTIFSGQSAVFTVLTHNTQTDEWDSQRVALVYDDQEDYGFASKIIKLS